MKDNVERPYFESLSGIRVICALAVILHHTLFYFDSSSRLLMLQLGNGAVTLFFVLSGFVLYHAHAQMDIKLWRYYKSRFIRLLPLYWFSLLLFFLFVGPSRFWMSNPSVKEILCAIFGIQSFVPYPRYYFAINPVGWFVSVEIFLCLLFPLFVLILRKKSICRDFLKRCLYGGGASIFMYLVLILVCISVLGYNEEISNFVRDNKVASNAFLRFNPLSRVFQFMSGMLLADFVQKTKYDILRENRFFSLNSMWIIVGLLLVYYVRFGFYYIHSSSETLNHIYNLTSIEVVNTLGALLVILCCVINKGYFCEFLSLKLWKDLGKLSYSVFLFHPILSAILFRNRWYNTLSTDWKIVIYFPLLICISSILYWLFECKIKTSLNGTN